MIYKGEYLREISFPLGGIGTGSVGLAGDGSLIDWEIFNRPNKNSINPYTFFAIRAEKPNGEVTVKVIQGDTVKRLTGEHSENMYEGFGFGPNNRTMCGFPHFKKTEFEGKFPIAKIKFSDENFPAKITLTAYNPFIPHDDFNSGLPLAMFHIGIDSFEEGVKYTVVFSMKNPFPKTVNLDSSKDGYKSVTMAYLDRNKKDRDYGEITVSVEAEKGFVQPYWYRGGWQDPVSTFWHELTTDTMSYRVYDSFDGNWDMCSVGETAVLKKGEKKEIPFALAWYVPNCYNYWEEQKDESGKDKLWKNYYATQFENSEEIALYALKNRKKLYKKTKDFCDSLHSSTLDKSVTDAVSSTLSVLKSPTVLRLEDGTFYGWEGLHEHTGSCEGTCTHVWSYQYALCFLFPKLERSIREAEYKYSTDKNGGMRFRLLLPLGRDMGEFRPCLDGQMASVIKSYREWKISGNDKWLKDNWSSIKKILEYAWNKENKDKWDENCQGVLTGRQHHTLDMELFGPSGWLQGMYLAGLRAGYEMACYLNDDAKEKYKSLFDKGYEFTKDNLFNGKYYIQKIDIRDRSYVEKFQCENYWNSEKNQLKYQIGEGCEIDQLLGQFHANLCGLGDIFPVSQRRTALENMFKQLYKPSMREFTNAWRVFAVNDEGGAVMCDYSKDVERPIIPIPYSDECMTGFEYAFAGLLISEGYVEKGLKIVKSIRDRYDGKKRNPWNEIECGSNYARAMSSFALIPIFSGFEFDMPKKYIGFSPIIKSDFKCLWSVGNSWGDFILQGKEARIKIKGEPLTLSSIKIKGVSPSALEIDGRKIEFTATKLENGEALISFSPTNIKKQLKLY